MKVEARGRRRLVALVLVAGLAATIGVVTTPTPASAMTDVDADGLDDGFEDALASQFFPRSVWFDSGEDCTAPASPGNPGTALTRVKRHPDDPAKIAIQYVLLFRRDCGELLGYGAHHGDVEPFAITAAPNPECPSGYGIFAVETVAHESGGGGVEQIGERLLGNFCDWDSKIYVSENKHGLYLADETCDRALLFTENCSESYALPFNVHNVGEDHARRIDDLSAFQFPGEYAWSPEPFEGGLTPGIFPGGDAGLIRSKWLQDSTARLLALATEPPSAAVSRCNQPSVAWYQTPSNNQNITQGQNLLVIAAGVLPDSIGTPRGQPSIAVFQFVQNGNVVTQYATRWANDNCVINQEYMPVWLAPGTYQVRVFFQEPVHLNGEIYGLPRRTSLPDLTVHPGGGGGGRWRRWWWEAEAAAKAAKSAK